MNCYLYICVFYMPLMASKNVWFGTFGVEGRTLIFDECVVNETKYVQKIKAYGETFTSDEQHLSNGCFVFHIV